jgi:hypothetical protein
MEHTVYYKSFINMKSRTTSRLTDYEDAENKISIVLQKTNV